VGRGKNLAGTYSAKTGYTLDLPAGLLLEYEGFLKDRHRAFWEFYPPMPPHDHELGGGAMLAVFSAIIRSPRNSPQTRILLECRVKGNIWGVVPLEGSADIF
jgi:hypothetical protein